MTSAGGRGIGRRVQVVCCGAPALGRPRLDPRPLAAFSRRPRIEAVADDASDLCCADGTVYRFEEIVRLCASTSRGNWAQAISGHLDALLAVRSEPRVDEMTAAELETQVRARVLPTASITASTTDLSYARPSPTICASCCASNVIGRRTPAAPLG